MRKIAVKYPATWFTVTDVPEFACQFFDPQPIVIDVASGLPVALVQVRPNADVTYDQALLAASDTKLWKGISKTATTVSGLPATQIIGTANGAGSYPAGSVRYGYLVDWGSKGSCRSARAPQRATRTWLPTRRSWTRSRRRSSSRSSPRGRARATEPS